MSIKKREVYQCSNPKACCIKRKNFLAQKIIVLLIILVVAGLLEIGFGFILLNRYRIEIRRGKYGSSIPIFTRTNQTL